MKDNTYGDSVVAAAYAAWVTQKRISKANAEFISASVREKSIADRLFLRVDPLHRALDILLKHRGVK